MQRLDGDDVDAIVQVGTNLGMAKIAAVAEKSMGKPVIAINTALYWHALRSMGIDDSISNFGNSDDQGPNRQFIPDPAVGGRPGPFIVPGSAEPIRGAGAATPAQILALIEREMPAASRLDKSVWAEQLDECRRIAPTQFMGIGSTWAQFGTTDEILSHAVDLMGRGADMYYTIRSYEVIERLDQFHRLRPSPAVMSQI